MAVITSSFFKHPLIREFDSKTSFSFASGDTKKNASCAIRDVYPTGYHNLPVKVLFNIFTFFDEKELRKCLMPVCRKWNMVALLPELWQRLEFRGEKIPPKFICQQLRILTNLQSIHLFNIPDAVTIIRQICRCNPRLISVGIKECSEKQLQGKMPESVLRNLVASCKKLQEIDLKGTQFSGNLFYLEVAVLPDIRSLNLSKNQYLHGRNLLELVLNCRTIEELKLTHRYKQQKLSDNDIQFLFCNLRPTLKSLSFDGRGLPDILFKLILECVNLEKLLLCNAMNMSGETFISIGKKLPYLNCLKMHKLTVPSEAYISLFSEGKYTLCNIKVLNLSECWKIDSNGLKSISECCQLLEKLILKSCREISNISPLFMNCKDITTLNLAFTNVNNNSILLIPRALKKLQKLFIDILDQDRRDVLEIMKTEYSVLQIVICLSEFNKNTIYFKV